MRKRNVPAIILCVFMMMGVLASCGGSGGEASKDNKTEAQFECGKETYDSLNTASDICVEMMTSIYNAWRFSIYDADEYSSYEVLSEFADEVNLTESELQAGWIAFTEDENPIDFKYFIDDFNVTTWVVFKAYEENGKVGELDDALSNARAVLKTMTSEYSDYSEYPTLKSYYSEVNSYAEFVKSPECSFEQLKTTISDYENKIRTYRSDLEFIFED